MLTSYFSTATLYAREQEQYFRKIKRMSEDGAIENRWPEQIIVTAMVEK